MFAFWKPRCPLDLQEKLWTEQRLQWLVSQFGIARMHPQGQLSDFSELVPADYRGTPDDVQEVFARLCRAMQIDPHTLQLEFFAEVQSPNTLGHYEAGERPVIRLLESLPNDPAAMLATLAHELAHHLLLGPPLVTGQESDHEWLTDLLVLYLGLGIEQASAAVTAQSGSDGTWHWWSISRHGYLPARISGYAMAVLAWIKEDPSPAWQAQLGTDARTAFVQGGKYLQKTGDCLIDRGRVEKALEFESFGAVQHALQGRSETFKLAALQALEADGALAARAAELVHECLDHKQPLVQTSAIRILSRLDTPSEHLLHVFIRLLGDPVASVRVAAAESLGRLAGKLDGSSSVGERAIGELLVGLSDSKSQVALAAAAALGEFGPRAQDATPKLLRLLPIRVHEGRVAESDVLFAALGKIDANIEARIRAEWTDGQSDVCNLVLTAYRRFQKGAPRQTPRGNPSGTRASGHTVL